jgi:SOS response regulatory protein OraA/RecX
MELRAKGIADTEAEEALSEIDEEAQIASAKTVLEKYMRGKTADAPTLQKAYRHLLSKGYSYEAARSALSALGEIDEEYADRVWMIYTNRLLPDK